MIQIRKAPWKEWKGGVSDKRYFCFVPSCMLKVK